MEWPVDVLAASGSLGLEHCVRAPTGWFLAGGQASKGSPNDSLWIAHAGPDGKRRWLYAPDAPGYDERISHLAPRLAGGLLVAGRRSPTNVDHAYGFVLALDEQGREAWTFPFGTCETNTVDGLLALPDGGAIYARHEYLPTVDDPGRDDWKGHDFLVQLDAHGNETSRRELEWAPSRCSIVGFFPWVDGFASLVAASEWGAEAQDFPLLLLVRGERTEALELRTSSITEPCGAVSLGPLGSAILGGVDWSPGPGKLNPCLLRLDPAGRVLWERFYGDATSDAPTCLAATPAGGLILGGVRLLEGGHPTPQAVWLIHVDAEGEVVWERRFHSGQRDSLCAVSLDSGGRVLAVGSTHATGEPERAWTLSLEANGDPAPWFHWRGVKLFDPLS